MQLPRHSVHVSHRTDKDMPGVRTEDGSDARADPEDVLSQAALPSDGGGDSSGGGGDSSGGGGHSSGGGGDSSGGGGDSNGGGGDSDGGGGDSDAAAIREALDTEVEESSFGSHSPFMQVGDKKVRAAFLSRETTVTLSHQLHHPSFC